MESIQLTDAHTGSTASVAVHLGMNCHAFRAVVDGQEIDVIDAPADYAKGSYRDSSYGIPVLFPFPNRIRDSRFEWNGREYSLPTDAVMHDGNGNAIHGFCLDRPWRVTRQTENSVIGEFQLSVDAPERLPLWPADFIIRIQYSLEHTVLRTDITIVNPSAESDLPWGFGTHPYFNSPLGAESAPKHCLLQAPAAELCELEACLPTGKSSPVPEEKDLREGAYLDLLKLDDVYTKLTPGSKALSCSIVDEHAGLQVVQNCDPRFRELVVYTPDGRDSVCIEPYTCLTDAVNLQAKGIDSGWQALGPGDEYHTWIEIEASQVVA